MTDDRDIRRLPPDPAGTQPKVELDALLPARREPEPEPFAFLDPPPVEETGPAAAEPAGEPPHAARFQFILGALMAIALVGLAGLGVIAADRATESEGPRWSVWQPSEDGVKGAQQIADHVAARYKGSNGKQLTVVTADEFKVELEAAEYPMRVAMRQRKEQGGEVKLLEGDDTVLFRVCGLAARCGMGGTPSKDRALLLRRQALEMALYAFRYLDGVKQIVMFMPPAYADARDEKTKKPTRIRLDNQALRFDRSELKGLLELPIDRVLPGAPPPLRKAMESPEAALVANATFPRVFTYSMVPANGEDEVFLVLEQLTNKEAIVRQEEAALELRKQAAEAAAGEPVEPLAGG